MDLSIMIAQDQTDAITRIAITVFTTGSARTNRLKRLNSPPIAAAATSVSIIGIP